jgi:hypothetical protein
VQDRRHIEKQVEVRYALFNGSRASIDGVWLCDIKAVYLQACWKCLLERMQPRSCCRTATGSKDPAERFSNTVGVASIILRTDVSCRTVTELHPHRDSIDPQLGRKRQSKSENVIEGCPPERIDACDAHAAHAMKLDSTCKLGVERTCTLYYVALD